METIVIRDTARAAAILRGGGLVAFPTETVYGLGADAANDEAVERIFEAKGRPGDNPLILHIFALDQVRELVDDVPFYGDALLDAFFPGPLTLVLERSGIVSDTVTAGLETVGIRMPDHPVAAGFLEAVGSPVAAPSANRSGRPSPTTWEAVEEDLGGRIDAILRGDPTRVGLESTVVDCTGDVPVVLRHGSITLDDIRFVVPGVRTLATDADEFGRRSPGLRHRHYSPSSRVVVAGAGQPSQFSETGKRVRRVWLGLSDPPDPAAWEEIRIVPDSETYARTLFAFFRECERRGIDEIHCQPVEETGIGRAVMDRLRRAAQ